MGLYLISYEEIGLKGNNREIFEDALIKRIKEKLKDFDKAKVSLTHKKIYVNVDGEQEQIIERLKKVFGIKSIAPAIKCKLDLDCIKHSVIKQLNDSNKNIHTFKIKARRSNKTFQFTSMDINRIVGKYVLDSFTNLKVDVHNPDVIIHIDIREHAYIYSEKISGAGGLPIGTVGKALLLLSGGIDSPVAGYMTMKRGANIDAVYFHSFPFTSDRAKEKVIKLCKVLSQYGGKINLFIVNFTEVIKELDEKTPNNYLTIMMRRMMIRIAEEIARKIKAQVLITGESLGQVASQTMESIYVVDEASRIPVLRPVIGMDKSEITELARKIGTFEISIEPYADCCTVFVPLSPITKPKLDDVLHFEKKLDIEKLIKQGLSDVEVIEIDHD